MKKNHNIIIVSAILMIIIAIGVFTYFPQAPKTHQKIVSSITITNLSRGYLLKPEFVQSNKLEWLSVVQLSVDFNVGNSYSQSLYVWKNPAGDIDYVATVWGPDETGTGYYVELARLCAVEMQISYDEGSIIFSEVSDWSNLKQEGYTVLVLTTS